MLPSQMPRYPGNKKLIPSLSTTPRTVCETRSRGLIVDRQKRADQEQPRDLTVPSLFHPPQSRRTGGGLSIIPGSDVFPYIYNSNTPETRLDISRIDTALYCVEILIPRADR